MNQSNGATVNHAQALAPIPTATRELIADWGTGAPPCTGHPRGCRLPRPRRRNRRRGQICCPSHSLSGQRPVQYSPCSIPGRAAGKAPNVRSQTANASSTQRPSDRLEQRPDPRATTHRTSVPPRRSASSTSESAIRSAPSPTGFEVPDHCPLMLNIGKCAADARKITRAWRKRTGVEPARDRLTASTGFEDRPPHRGRSSSSGDAILLKSFRSMMIIAMADGRRW